jgi:hypothetical protein
MPEIAAKTGIEQNCPYRVLPGLTENPGRATPGRGYLP